MDSSMCFVVVMASIASCIFVGFFSSEVFAYLKRVHVRLDELDRRLNNLEVVCWMRHRDSCPKFESRELPPPTHTFTRSFTCECNDHIDE